MRTVDETKLERKVIELVREIGPPHTLQQSIRSRLRAWIRRQPRAPHLVARQEAARILGVQSPHIARFIEQERMPAAVEVDGGPPVWVREEVEALAEELEEERERRRAKKEEAAA